MKKILLSIILFITCYSANAQGYVKTKVGIPGNDANNAIGENAIWRNNIMAPSINNNFPNQQNWWSIFQTQFQDTKYDSQLAFGLNQEDLWLRFNYNGNWKKWKKIVLTDYNGNVGIGTTNPSTKLHVVGNQNSNWVSTVSNTAAFGHSIYTGYNNGDVTYGLVIEGGKTGIYDIDFAVTNKFYIKGNGNVGIGTKNPDSKLAVNGKIHTKEVKVDLIGWSDFVFEDKYELPTLKEVENYINEKGHLKDIPSAKEVTKNGIYLGEMNAKLLQKIEELTLYTIKQEKKIKQQESNLKMLLKRIEKLERK